MAGGGGGGSLAGVHAPHQLLAGLWVSPQHAGVEKQHAHSLALTHVGWKVSPHRRRPRAGVCRRRIACLHRLYEGVIEKCEPGVTPRFCQSYELI